MSDIGDRVKAERLRRAYGQAELARAIDITATSLWAIESGRHQPRPVTIRKIANALAIPVEWLTEGGPHA